METKKSNVYDALILGTSVLLATTVLGVVVYQLRKKKRRLDNIKSMQLGATDVSSRFRCVSKSFPLSFGTCHPDVGRLQRHLIHLGADLGSYGPHNDGVDNMFGSKTYSAARQFLGKTTFTSSELQTLLTT